MHRNLSRLTATVALAGSAAGALGAGFQVSEHSASGLGRAFAGEAAIAENAAILARNPAAMNYFDTMQISVAGTAVIPSIDVKDESNNQTAEGIAPAALVPGAYYISPVNDVWSFGLALYTDYGVTTEYPKDWAAGDNAGLTGLTTVKLSPNFAFRLYEGLSFGLGVSLVYGDAELERHLGALAPLFNKKPSDLLISMSGDAYDWGWNTGLFYEVNDNHRFGLTYKSEVNLQFDGDFKDYTGAITGTEGLKVDGRLDLLLPAIAEFAGYHDINESWSIQYSVNWTQWSRFKEIRATNPICNAQGAAGVCFLKEENYKDSWQYSIGATTDVADEWKIRFGISYDERAGQPTLSIPDANRYWLSFGSTWNFAEHQSIDAGYTFIFSESNTFNEEGLTGSGPYEATGNASLFALQYNYSF
ncbi:47 kDa outer membrane protein [BD1-7 clade bacterium]|uniref:47 kDa outer membrane protein n=1 Tax=BD1-7 clade bacterium TaxID=2029982 RepID=A0A5S9P6Q5_9GAMM|nr:47 kDa outer membrane protein [BD1-7 clade bacterium]CAA0099114.1 47 kDa outer membrane protein [BD1-7 clade bacterium]